MPTTTRPTAVAGRFYPENPQQLRQQIQGFMSQASIQSEQAPKAIIAPHAGYVYSGAIAANAYAQLLSRKDKIKRVVLLGPAHSVAFRGIATSSANHYQSPFGLIKLDQATQNQLLTLPQVQLFDIAHAQEHSLEVHLPFLQYLLTDFSLIPLVVGNTTPQAVAEVLAEVWGGDETLIVISSDLSHYHDYQTAKSMDQATSQSIVALQYQTITPEDACGCHPINGLLYYAKQQQLHSEILDLRNSGDTAGPRSQVVGYGAYGFYPSSHS